MNRLKRQLVLTLVIVTLLQVIAVPIPIAYGPQIEPKPEPKVPESVTLRPNVLPELTIGIVGDYFHFAWRKNYFDMKLFIAYTESKATTMVSPSNFLSKDASIKWSQVKTNDLYRYEFGYMVEDIPKLIADKVEYLLWKIEDANFDFQIETREVNDNATDRILNLTRFYLPDNLVLSYEDLQLYDFTVTYPSKYETKIENVKGKTSWNLDPIALSTDIVEITGYSLAAPARVQYLYDADMAGSRTILDNQVATLNMNATVRPANKALTLNVTIANLTSAGWCNLTGTDIEDNGITDNITVSANTTYQTTKQFRTIDDNGIDCDFAGNITILQSRWGVISKNDDYAYYGTYYGAGFTLWDVKIQVGDGSTPSYFGIPYGTHQAYMHKALVWNAYSFAKWQKIIRVMDNGWLRVGLLLDENDKSVRARAVFIGGWAGGGAYWIYGEEGSEVQVYGATFGGGSIQCLEDTRFWSVNLYGGSIQGSTGDTHDLFDVMTQQASYPIYGCEFTTDDFKLFENTRMYFSRYGTGGLLLGFYGRGNTYVCTWQSSGGNITLLDPDIDNWAFAFGGNPGYCFRQYSFGLTVTYLNATAINGTETGARIVIQHYGEGAGVDYNATLGGDGTIITQNLTMGFYNATGGDAIYDYNPYNLQITNVTGYQDYDGNFTLDDKTEWTMALLEEIVTDPVARFTFTPSNPRPQQSISFDATESSDSDGTISSYSWTFGDGNSDSGNTTAHSYTTDGSFNVTLTVTDDDGATSSFSQTVAVLLGGTSTRIPQILEVNLNPIDSPEPSLVDVWWWKSTNAKAYVTVTSLLDVTQDVQIIWWVTYRTHNSTVLTSGNRTLQLDPAFFPTVTATLPFTIPLNEGIVPRLDETYSFHATVTVMQQGIGQQTSEEISVLFGLSSSTVNTHLTLLVVAIIVLIIALIVAIQKLRHKLNPEAE